MRDESDRVDQAVHVDGAVGNAGHASVAGQVLDLVQIQGAGDQSLQRALAGAADELVDAPLH